MKEEINWERECLNLEDRLSKLEDELEVTKDRLLDASNQVDNMQEAMRIISHKANEYF